MSIEVATDESFTNLARQMGKIVDQLNRGYYSFFSSETWTPNVNLYETDDAYQVCVDLAGVDKEKIDLEVHGSRLTIRGVRPTPTKNHDTGSNAANHDMSNDRPGAQASPQAPDGAAARPRSRPRTQSREQSPEPSPAMHPMQASNPKRTRVHLMEIDHGAFARAVDLPHDVAADRITAEHRNGMLWIELPKK